MAKQQPTTAKQVNSLWSLGGLTPWQLVHNVFEEIRASNIFGRTSELAFYFLFALFPLILLLMTLFGLFASHRVELQNVLESYFAELIPPSAFQLLRHITNELAAHASGRKLTFGIVAALWSASSGVQSMISALNLSYHVPEARAWFKVRTIALGLTVVIAILVLTALFMVLAGNHFVGWIGTGLELHPVVVFAWKAIQWPLAILFVSISCSLIYYSGPNLKERRRWQWMTPGAAFSCLLWLLASVLFRILLALL
ncbi:YihY/virulence factor BrkB family protein [Edaphobacter modestus]|uniref:YihY/virulence factor BrkB family protein n=1 Tax=Edaphobacter modestus TaxID=388466 RepID=UPI0013EE64CC|nr:YihY/virulence factor BrkB family protein [Edaphobacter modestus]